MTRLFPEEDLLKWEQEYRTKQLEEHLQEVSRRIRAHEQPVLKQEFIYRSRSESDWDARANQPTRRPRWERIHGHFVLSQQGREDLAKKVKTLLELAVEYRDETDMEELAASANMSVSWVRKHLSKAGIRLPLRRQR